MREPWKGLCGFYSVLKWLIRVFAGFKMIFPAACGEIYFAVTEIHIFVKRNYGNVL